MSTTLAHSNYGKSRVQLIKLARQQDRHDLKQITVDVQFEGDFESSFLYGDNTKILPADTMKNTVYAFAKLYPIEQIEDFARQLAEHFLTGNDQVSRVRVAIAEDLWSRIPFGAKPHASTFMPTGLERRTALASGTRDSIAIEGGIDRLTLVRSAGAGFENYLRDPFTTLREAPERILSAVVKAAWTYTDTEIPFGPYWHGVREALLQTFIEHDSKSVQHTLYAMGNAVLDRYQNIAQISLSISSRECVVVDLSSFGLENANEVFTSAVEPYALMEARVQRSGGDGE